MKSILSLVQYLGVGSVIMPLLSGTFFGLKLGELFHREGIFFGDMQLFWFSIVFGAAHIIFAKLVHAFDAMKRQGFQHGLAPLGWTLVLIGTGLIAARSFLSLPVPPVVITIVLSLGVALFLFFTSTSKNPFVRIGKGIAALYDVVGIFGDLLSYIRLFGLATAGGILGFVVNTMGGMMFNIPYIGYVLGGLVLLVGHIGVMALSSIGAFVHPMRLTFVEFYKHVGFEGGGRPYKPLKKNKL
jgi:V/A-type H+-transporting ATPase subunit I